MNIVLAHGILGFSKFAGVAYFNHLKEHLESRFHVNVFAPQVNPIASIADRGSQLSAKILEALGDTGIPPVLDPSKKVHIIAHSMGGLDSRLILSPNTADNIADRIASLTTIGTPHQGSPIADLFYAPVDEQSLPPFVGSLEHVVKEIFEKLVGQTLFDGLRDLTTANARDFNRHVIDADHNEVNYFCVAGRGRDALLLKTCGLMLPTFGYLKEIIGEDNDGVVTVSSAQRNSWGVLGDPWPVDHLEEVGHNIDLGPLGKPAFDYISEYEKLVEHLQSI